MPPPETVTTAVAQTQTWEALLTAVGSLAAVQGVTVAAEVPGKVVRIAFEPGAKVKAGDAAGAAGHLGRGGPAPRGGSPRGAGEEQPRPRRAAAGASGSSPWPTTTRPSPNTGRPWPRPSSIRAGWRRKPSAPLYRPPRHPPGQSRADPRRRASPSFRCRPSTRSSSISSCPSSSCPAEDRDRRADDHRRLPGRGFQRQDDGDQSRGRCRHPQHPPAGHGGQCPRSSCGPGCSSAWPWCCRTRPRCWRFRPPRCSTPPMAIRFSSSRRTRTRRPGRPARSLRQQFVRLGEKRGDFVAVFPG